MKLKTKCERWSLAGGKRRDEPCWIQAQAQAQEQAQYLR